MPFTFTTWLQGIFWKLVESFCCFCNWPELSRLNCVATAADESNQKNRKQSKNPRREDQAEVGAEVEAVSVVSLSLNSRTANSFDCPPLHTRWKISRSSLLTECIPLCLFADKVKGNLPPPSPTKFNRTRDASDLFDLCQGTMNDASPSPSRSRSRS